MLNRAINLGSIFFLLLGAALLVAWPVAAIAQTALPVTIPLEALDLPLPSQVDVDSAVQTVNQTLSDQAGVNLPGAAQVPPILGSPIPDTGIDPETVVDSAQQTVNDAASDPEGSLPQTPPLEPPAQLPGTGTDSGSDTGGGTINLNGATSGPIDIDNLIIDPLTSAIISPAALAVVDQGLAPLTTAATELGRLGVSPGNGDFQVSPAGASDASDSFSPSTGLALLPLLGLVCAFMGVAAYLGSAQKVRHAQA